MLVIQSWRGTWIQRELEKSHRNNYMPLKPVKFFFFFKELCSVAQNDLTHLRLKNGDFFSSVWVRKVWVTPGPRHQPDAVMEEANVTLSYITIGGHWPLVWCAWDHSSHACQRKRRSNRQMCRKYIPGIYRMFYFMQKNINWNRWPLLFSLVKWMLKGMKLQISLWG